MAIIREQYMPLHPPGMEDLPEELRPWANELARYLIEELRRVGFHLDLLKQLNLPQNNVEPSKPRDGDVRYADGTNWDPGSGEGVYAYYNATWNKL